MITWEDFNITNSSNKKTAFENMCRVFFNYYFFDNKAILMQKSNNPGIEVEPIEYNGKKISFQSKYIESENIYQQIKHSAEIAISHYKGKLDTIYLFSNKDLDPDSKQYKEIVDILNPHNINIERICNQEILSIIETRDYKTLKLLFFGKHNLTKEWFDLNLQISLEDLEPRYISGFNVDTHIQNYFEIKYMSDEVFKILNNILTEWKQDLKYINTKHPSIESVKSKLNKLQIPTKENFDIIFKWYDLFKNELIELSKLARKLDKDLAEKSDESIKNTIITSRRDCYKTIRIIEEINFSNNNLFNSYKSNVLFIEGDAGIGKSHLLGYEAEKHGNSSDRTILLLGQKIIGNNSPLEQIKEQLNTTISIDDLFDTLEGMGEIDNSNTIIMIDALNESAHHTIWKNYLNTLVTKILKYKHIKLIATIRSTYVNQIFSNVIQCKIANKEIYKIKHVGFEGIIDDAITKFFEFYKIPVDTLSYLGYSFTNPLFLKIYCKAYAHKNKGIGSKSLDEIFNQYIREEETKIKEKLSIDDNYPYCRKILENLAKYLYENQSTSINIEKLFEINNTIPNYEKFIPQMQKSKLLISYIYDDIENIYFGYERLCDFYIAKIIVNKFSNYNDLKDFLIQDLLKLNQYNRLIRYNVAGVFSALSILVSEKFDEEILSIIDKTNIDEYEKQQIVQEYINNLSFRDDNKINKDKLLCALENNITTDYLVDNLYNTLITLSGRSKNPLNASYLHQTLKLLDLNKRDACWTTFINHNYEENCQLFHIVNYFEKKLFVGDYDTKKLYSILLTWILSSTNRKLRDRVSRCITNIFKNNYTLMVEILEMFYDINDPYIIQRLYGIIYGAILKSGINIEELTKLSSKIYQYVFDSKNVYPDILLRDYALNIIEYAKYLNCPISFDIEKCRPPYNSKQIPIIDNSIEEYFSFDGKNYTGANSIKSSLTPNINGGYGDFGRYVFESALSNFEGIDINNLYLYALYLIKNELGYTNELFSNYDRNTQRLEGYGRHNTTKIERIGKKYQWIAFYHILALVSDNYKLSQKYSERSSDKYLGSWNPYVRDFDPTLDLVSSSRKYDFNLYLNQPIYSNWSDNDDWINNKNDVINFKNLIFLKDNKEEEWIYLHGHLKEQTSRNYEEDYKEVWRMVSAYVIKSENYISFIEKLKVKPLWGRWFPESGDRYNIFSREYCWSPAYKDEYFDVSFDIEIDTGKTIKRTKTVPKFEFIEDISAESKIFKYIQSKEETFTYDEHVREKIGNVKPLWNSYLWEEEYDASKEESIGIYFPSQEIIESLKLIQKENGMFYYEDKLVVADFSLMEGTTEGLFIKKSYLERFLKDNDYRIFWICIGEKNDIKKSNFLTAGNDSKFKDFSSLVYIENDEVVSSDFFEDRKDHY